MEVGGGHFEALTLERFGEESGTTRGVERAATRQIVNAFEHGLESSATAVLWDVDLVEERCEVPRSGAR